MAASPALPIIAVCGATGKQGGGVINSLLKDAPDTFAIRAITRDETSAKAQALRDRGIEVVSADFDSVSSLQKAFSGAHGGALRGLGHQGSFHQAISPSPAQQFLRSFLSCSAFCVTNFWEHFDAKREARQAAALAQACQSAGVRHVVWSTLEDTREFAKPGERMPAIGEYSVPHFDEKGAADHLFRELKVPTTFLRTSFFFENFCDKNSGLGPQRRGANDIVLALPIADSRLPGISVHDIGGCVVGCFKDPSTINQTIGIAGDVLTGKEYAAAFSQVLGVNVMYEATAMDKYRRSGQLGVIEFANMFQFQSDFEEQFVACRKVNRAKELYSKLQDFKTWLTAHKADFQHVLQ
jgi:uncharacterized protein YbjT (DUF2867 family)